MNWNNIHTASQDGGDRLNSSGFLGQRDSLGANQDARDQGPKASAEMHEEAAMIYRTAKRCSGGSKGSEGLGDYKDNKNILTDMTCSQGAVKMVG